MTKPKKRRSHAERLAAGAEVVAYIHHRLGELLALDRPLTALELQERVWLMEMFGSAAADLLDLSLPTEMKPTNGPVPSRRRRGVVLGSEARQSALPFAAEGGVRLVAVDGRRVKT